MILDLLTPHEKKRGLLVLGLVLVMAGLETVGVASVMPFLSVLGNQAVIHTDPRLAWAYERLGFTSATAFMIALGIASFVLVVVSALVRIVTHYALYRYTNMRRHSVSQRLLARYLRQPYEFFLNRNTADLSKGILSEVDELARNVFKPGIELIAYGATALALAVFLFIMDPVVMLGISAVLGGSYGLIYLRVRGVLGGIGRARAEANRERFTAASEVLGGIKDIKVLGREDAYLSRFRGPSARYSRYQTTSTVLSEVPKYIVEAVGFGCVLAFAVFLISTRGDLGDALPILGLYAFAGYRLLPAAQRIFSAMAKLRFGRRAIELIHADLVEVRTDPDQERSPRVLVDESPVPIDHDIRLRGVSYSYPESGIPALAGIDVTIPRHSSLGIVGSTGAGKTTLVDLLLGLLQPTSGDVLVDGRSILDVGIRRWQTSIGYVPQYSYLTDASIAENVALGLNPANLDLERVEIAARAAQVHDFVTTLPDGYATVVGERGVRLSGGQRQRIGIARALYRDPALLVLDEATNALDIRTEARAMEAIAALRGRKTLVIIAHRISTVQECDQILVLENGKVAGLGRYQELKGFNEAFRRVAAL
jgi:ATP-binding cassette, subfamily B, bacterial PglK